MMASVPSKSTTQVSLNPSDLRAHFIEVLRGRADREVDKRTVFEAAIGLLSQDENIVVTEVDGHAAVSVCLDVSKLTASAEVASKTCSDDSLRFFSARLEDCGRTGPFGQATLQANSGQSSLLVLTMTFPNAQILQHDVRRATLTATIGEVIDAIHRASLT